MKKVELRVATSADIETWFGVPTPYSMSALVAEEGEELLALFGVYREGENMVAIAGIRPEMRKRKKELARMLGIAQTALRRYRTVIALADKNEPTAPRFLAHLGFIPIGFMEDGGEVYRWTR